MERTALPIKHWGGVIMFWGCFAVRVEGQKLHFSYLCNEQLET